MKLLDLDPRWFDVPGVGTNKDGVTFLCPCATCQNGTPVRLAVQFKNPVGGSDAVTMSAKEVIRHVHELRTFDVPPKGPVWERTGETFEQMTLSPSVDASASGHWHGYITKGEIR